MSYGMRLIAFEGIPGPGVEPVAAGSWLRDYDPEAHDGRGSVTWTSDPKLALAFETPSDALAAYRRIPTSRPLRPDGQPNRPLTAATVEVVPLPKEQP